MKRIGRNVTLVLIFIFVLTGLKVLSLTCYAQTTESEKEIETYQFTQKEKEYYTELAESDPWTALRYLYNCYVYLDIKDYAFMQKIIEIAGENDPVEILYWMVHWKKIERLAQESKKIAIKTILAIKDSSYNYPYGTKRQMSILLQEIVVENMSLEEAANIVRDSKKFFEALVRIKSQPNHLGKVAVERKLKHLSLRMVRRINYLHNELDSIRFELVKDASSLELYTLMVYGEEEIFTSSFNGLFERLLDAMEKEEINGNELLENLGHNKFRTFIKLCAGFNRLNEFLETMEKDLQKSLLRKFVTGIDKEKNSLGEAVVIADTFSMVEDKEILKVLQETIKSEYERVKSEESKEGKILYGLLAGMFGKKAVINEVWIKEMAEKYQLPDLTGISSEELFDSNGLNVQQYFFYNDKDGRASFWSFLSQYKGKRGWKIEDKGSFILIRSTRDSKKIEIYANKPKAARKGPEEIAKIFEGRNIQPVVVVHRGHSYHVPKTIERIPSSVRIVSLGSCGGYNNISLVLGRASEAHIISTKAKGTMLVNDPLLKMLNEEILTGKDIYWPDFWQKAEKRLGRISDFKNYIPPHKNLGVLFLKAYHRLIEN